jgi:predicted acylesterase/phospholipase RssA
MQVLEENLWQKGDPARLVLQGGGALGAYEAGVIKALTNKLAEEHKKNGGSDRPMFNVIAGVSIGSVNATILVCHVLDGLREKPRPS